MNVQSGMRNTRVVNTEQELTFVVYLLTNTVHNGIKLKTLILQDNLYKKQEIQDFTFTGLAFAQSTRTDRVLQAIIYAFIPLDNVQLLE